MATKNLNSISNGEHKVRDLKRARCQASSRRIVRSMESEIIRIGHHFENEHYLNGSEKVQERAMRRIVEKKMAQAAHKSLKTERSYDRFASRMVDAYTSKCFRLIMAQA